MNILHIDASASDAATSHSRRLSAALVDRLKQLNPGSNVTYRDVVADQLPHVDTTIREAWTSEAVGGSALADTAARSKRMVAELKAADVVVIGSPMYNFSVPSTLKAWIDHVAIAGQTFRYTPEGPEGLLTTRAYLCLSSGGVYSEGSFSSNDHLGTYLSSILAFMGVKVVETVRVEGVAYGADRDAAAMAEAISRIGRLEA